MYYLSILIVILFCSVIVFGDDEDGEEKVESLCDNPIIHSADRLVNNTVRVYRNNHYWELIGIPDRKTSVNGPFKIWYPNFAPIAKNASTHSALSGAVKGIQYKYWGKKWWSWWHNGRQRSGGVKGDDWFYFPNNGFTAVYHDGNASGEGIPLMVAFQSIRVYYFNSGGLVWTPVGTSEGYVGGKFGENFPSDITSAFSYPSDDQKIKYFVYLFKRDKHCFRPWKLDSGKDCDQWRDNKELFDCNKESGGGQTPPPIPPPEEPSENPPVGGQPGETQPQPGGEPPAGPAPGGQQPEPQPPDVGNPEGGETPSDSSTTEKDPGNNSFNSQTSLTLVLVSIYFIFIFK